MKNFIYRHRFQLFRAGLALPIGLYQFAFLSIVWIMLLPLSIVERHWGGLLYSLCQFGGTAGLVLSSTSHTGRKTIILLLMGAGVWLWETVLSGSELWAPWMLAGYLTHLLLIALDRRQRTQAEVTHA